METRKQDEPTRGWSADERAHFEQRLLAERKRAVAQMDQFGDDMRAEEDADGELTSWRFHMADEGTDTYEREQVFLLASREGRLLWNIDQALRRLYRAPEEFGHCTECGTRIGYERLDAIPYAFTCMTCKKDWEGSRAPGASASTTPAPPPPDAPGSAAPPPG